MWFPVSKKNQVAKIMTSCKHLLLQYERRNKSDEPRKESQACCRPFWGIRRALRPGNPDGGARGVGTRVRENPQGQEIPRRIRPSAQRLCRTSNPAVFCASSDRE